MRPPCTAMRCKPPLRSSGPRPPSHRPDQNRAPGAEPPSVASSTSRSMRTMPAGTPIRCRMTGSSRDTKIPAAPKRADQASARSILSGVIVNGGRSVSSGRPSQRATQWHQRGTDPELTVPRPRYRSATSSRVYGQHTPPEESRPRSAAAHRALESHQECDQRIAAVFEGLQVPLRNDASDPA